MLVFSRPGSVGLQFCTEAPHSPSLSQSLDWWVSDNTFTRKFLNFQTSTNFTVSTLKIQTKQFYLGILPINDANGIANSEDLDQTAPLGAV